MSETFVVFQRLGEFVLTWSWQVAVLILFAWIGVRLDRRHRPTLRHRLWSLTLLACLMSPWILDGVAGLSWTKALKDIWTVPAPRSVLSPVGQISRPTNGTGAETQPTALPDPTLRTLPLFASPSTQAMLTWFVGIMWPVGVAVASVRRLILHVRLNRMAVRATPSDASTLALVHESTPPILLSREVRSPMLYGWFRPVVLLPDDIMEWSTPVERELIIRHERVHWARKDHWVSVLEVVVTTLLFFHPMVRWMGRQFRIEQELACDESLLRLGSDPECYADSILKVAEHAIAGGVGLYFATASNLDRRVNLLFRSRQVVPNWLLTLVPGFLLFTPLIVMGFREAKVESPVPITELFAARMLPTALPLPPSVAAVPARRIVGREPMRVQDPPEAPATPPTVAQPETLAASMDILKGRTPSNELLVTLQFPYSALVFEPGRFNGFQAAGTFSIQITRISGSVIGRTEETFTVFVGQTPDKGVAVVQRAFLVDPGLYRLFAVVTDSASGKQLTVDRRLEVPAIPPDTLALSSLILADLAQVLNEVSPSFSFRISNMRVRPNVTRSFRRDQGLNVVQQIYAHPSSSGRIDFDIRITHEGREVRQISDEFAASPEITVSKSISLSDFTPGTYTVRTTAIDRATGTNVASMKEFRVE